MKHYTNADIRNLDKLFRLNLINSCTGYKSANLIATRSTSGVSNVAVFNSVFHLGSNPPLLGFIMRPATVPRNTLENINATSTIKMGCRYVNEYHIKENDSILIVAEIEHLYFEEGIQMPDGWLRLEDAETVAINGLDGYALPTLLDRFHYARPGKEIKSFFKEEK